MKNIFRISGTILIIFLLQSCKKDKPTPPVVSTNSVTAISYTTATSGGNATNEGGTSIVSKGVCWNTSTEPTITNSKTTESDGLGAFTSNLTQLTPNTLYYVRAYATNSAGTGYGNQVSFTTIQIALATLTTTEISTITQTSAVSGGNITDDNGGSITTRGVCWGTTENPTTDNNKTTDGTGTGSFGSNLTGLQPGTIYYVRSYATNSAGTSYGNEISFTTKERVVTSIQITNIPDSLVVSKKIILNTLVTYETGDPAHNPLLVWSSGNPQIATVSSTGEVLGISGGTTKIIASYNNYVKEIEIKVTPIEITIIDSYLSTPASGYIKEIPVVIMRFLPTADGINIDVSKSSDFYVLGEISLNDMKSNIDTYDKRIKFSLEEGSKYRGYKDSNAQPYLGYKVVGYITIYEQLPISNQFTFQGIRGIAIYQPDFIAIFSKFNIKDFVENKGVKEIWIWHGTAATPDYPCYNPNIHKPMNMVTGPESNMSSPTTYDISNSLGYNNDLPIYNKTYTVYCYNNRRTQAEAVHNHGHQLERIYKYADQQQVGYVSLFLQKFCGWGDDYYKISPIGRAGDCHHPPNTTKDYDYLNATLVESDIEDWKPEGGTKTTVNVDTWGKLTYNWPGGSDFNQRVESQWYIYWMQNMPGYNNNILFSTGKKMTNWWIFTEDWDSSIKAKEGLHE